MEEGRENPVPNSTETGEGESLERTFEQQNVTAPTVGANGGCKSPVWTVEQHDLTAKTVEAMGAFESPDRREMEQHDLTVTMVEAKRDEKSPARREFEQEAAAEANLVGDGKGIREGGGSAEVVVGGIVSVVAQSEVMKRKRGRPKKYENGYMAVTPIKALAFPSAPLEPPSKRGPGRPRGSGKLQLLANVGGFIADTAGGNFTPHVLNVQPGEDIVGRISSFSQSGPRAVCVLSATGLVSSVVINQPGPSGVLKYEGHFEILSLSGSFTCGEKTGAYKKNGTLNVSLAKPDGWVFGGCVAGSLVAGGRIQLILGTFKQNISKDIKRRHIADSSNAVNEFGHPNDTIVPKQSSPEMEHGDENCPTTKSVLLNTKPTLPGNIIIGNQNMNSDSIPSVDQNLTPPTEPTEYI